MPGGMAEVRSAGLASNVIIATRSVPAKQVEGLSIIDPMLVAMEPGS